MNSKNYNPGKAKGKNFKGKNYDGGKNDKTKGKGDGKHYKGKYKSKGKNYKGKKGKGVRSVETDDYYAEEADANYDWNEEDATWDYSYQEVYDPNYQQDAAASSSAMPTTMEEHPTSTTNMVQWQVNATIASSPSDMSIENRSDYILQCV